MNGGEDLDVGCGGVHSGPGDTREKAPGNHGRQRGAAGEGDGLSVCRAIRTRARQRWTRQVCSTSSPQSTGLLHLVPSVYWSAPPRSLSLLVCSTWSPPPPRASSTLPVKLGLQLPQPLQVRSSPRPLRQPMHRGLVLTAARRREAPQRDAAEGRRRETPQRDAAAERRRRETPPQRGAA
jgi:hypothetical protein